MNDKLKFCVNCKHYKKGSSYVNLDVDGRWCIRDLKESKYVDLVSGTVKKEFSGAEHSAINERYPHTSASFGHIYCGGEGIYWEKKDE